MKKAQNVTLNFECISGNPFILVYYRKVIYKTKRVTHRKVSFSLKKQTNSMIPKHMNSRMIFGDNPTFLEHQKTDTD